MKNLSLILNIILLLAVGFLMVQHFSGSKGNVESTLSVDGTPTGTSAIVYINEDSLLNNFQYFVKKRNGLAERERQASASLQSKGQALEQDVRAVQAKVQKGLLAPNQIAQEEQRIGRRQQELVQEQERISQELIQETQKLNVELQADVKELLETLKEENGYDFVLSYGQGSGVLMVNESLDITNLVLERLNAKRPATAQ